MNSLSLAHLSAPPLYLPEPKSGIVVKLLAACRAHEQADAKSKAFMAGTLHLTVDEAAALAEERERTLVELRDARNAVVAALVPEN